MTSMAQGSREAITGGATNSSPLVLRRKCACGSRHEKASSCKVCGQSGGRTLRRRSTPTGPVAVGGEPVPSVVHEVLGRSGRPLETTLRRDLESRFRHDFSGVRIHADAAAGRAAEAVGAEAFAVGRDLVFARGRFEPQHRRGRSLLTHELAHVVQARGASSGSGPIRLGDPASPAEFAADQLARAAESGAPASAGPPADPTVIRRKTAGTMPAQSGTSGLSSKCFAPGEVFNADGRSPAPKSLGEVAERFIEPDFQDDEGLHYNDVYFDDSRTMGGMVEFLARKHKLTSHQKESLKGSRADMLASRALPPNRTYYEIKPDSESGRRAGEAKLKRLRNQLRGAGLRQYRPGSSYPRTSPRVFDLSHGVYRYMADGPAITRIWLEVKRRQNGLLVYKLCVEGEWGRVKTRAAALKMLAHVLVNLEKRGVQVTAQLQQALAVEFERGVVRSVERVAARTAAEHAGEAATRQAPRVVVPAEEFARKAAQKKAAAVAGKEATAKSERAAASKAVRGHAPAADLSAYRKKVAGKAKAARKAPQVQARAGARRTAGGGVEVVTEAVEDTSEHIAHSTVTKTARAHTPAPPTDLAAYRKKAAEKAKAGQKAPQVQAKAGAQKAAEVEGHVAAEVVEDTTKHVAAEVVEDTGKHVAPKVVGKGVALPTLEQGAKVAERKLAQAAEPKLAEAAGKAARVAIRGRMARILARFLESKAARLTAKAAGSIIPVLGWGFSAHDAYLGVLDIVDGHVGRGLSGIGCAAADVGSDFLHLADVVTGPGGTAVSLTVQGGTIACQVAIQVLREQQKFEALIAEIERSGQLPSEERLKGYYDLDDETIAELRRAMVEPTTWTEGFVPPLATGTSPSSSLPPTPPPAPPPPAP